MVLVRKNQTFKTIAIYRKPIHTGQYIHCTSHLHTIKKERSYLQDTFEIKGSPQAVILHNFRKKTRNEQDNVATKPPNLFLPYTVYKVYQTR